MREGGAATVVITMRIMLALALLAVVPRTAAAAPPEVHDPDGTDDIDGAEARHLRVHIDTEALGGAWMRRDATPTERAHETVSFGAGVARPSLLDDGAALFARPVIGFGLGYLFENQRALLGAKLALTLDGYGVDDDNRMFAVGGRFVPYLQWLFRPGHAVRPYVEARLGFGGIVTTRDNPMTGPTNARVIYPLVGVGGGVHLFAREWFSVDLGLDLDYAAPHLRSGYRDAEQADTAWEKRADVIGFGARLGISTWF